MQYKRRETTFCKAIQFDGRYDSFRAILDMGIQGSFDEANQMAYLKTHNGTQSVWPLQFVVLNEFGIVAVYNVESFIKNFTAIQEEG
jgi:hypothetical protein